MYVAQTQAVARDDLGHRALEEIAADPIEDLEEARRGPAEVLAALGEPIRIPCLKRRMAPTTAGLQTLERGDEVSPTASAVPRKAAAAR